MAEPRFIDKNPQIIFCIIENRHYFEVLFIFSVFTFWHLDYGPDILWNENITFYTDPYDRANREIAFIRIIHNNNTIAFAHT